MPTAPTQNGIPLDRFNDAMRESPAWRQFIERSGFRLDGSPIRLSESQRRALASELRRAGFVLPNGVEVDPAGNVNQDDTGFFEKTSVRIGIAAAAALATAGALGWGPLAMLAGGQAPAAGGALASSSIPGLHAAVPGAIASQGASAGIGAAGAVGGGALAGKTIAGLHAAVPGAVGGAQAASNGVPRFGGDDTGGGWLDSLKQFATDPKSLAGLAALYPALQNLTGGGSGSNPSEDALLDEARQGMALQRKRIEQTQPVFDTIVRMAYGNAPTRHRGAPPEGYQDPPAGYTFTPPRFGGR